MKIIITLIGFLDTLAPLLALGCFLIKRPRLREGLGIIMFYLLLQLLLNSISTVMEQLRITNYSIYFINTFISFLLLFYLFSRQPVQLSRQLRWWVNLSFITISLVAFLHGEGVDRFNSYQSAMASLVITVCCLHYFYENFFQIPVRTGIADSSLFWCIIGLFTYYAGTFLIAIYYSSLIRSNTTGVGSLWIFHNILLAICCLYICYGVIWKKWPIPSSSY